MDPDASRKVIRINGVSQGDLDRECEQSWLATVLLQHITTTQTSGPRIANFPRLLGKSQNSKFPSESLYLCMSSNMAASPAEAADGVDPLRKTSGQAGQADSTARLACPSERVER